MTLETVESGWIEELDPVDRSRRNKPSCGRGTLAAIDDDEMLNGLVGLPGDAFECRFQQGIARRWRNNGDQRVHEPSRPCSCRYGNDNQGVKL